MALRMRPNRAPDCKPGVAIAELFLVLRVMTDSDFTRTQNREDGQGSRGNSLLRRGLGEAISFLLLSGGLRRAGCKLVDFCLAAVRFRLLWS